MQSWRWKYDRLWAVLEYIESVRWIDLYVDCKASSIQFDHRQTAKKQTIKYDNNKRLMSNLGLFSRANHAICTFKYRSDIINGMQMMQSVFLCMGNPYARPDASGYHRRMVVYKCALPEKECHPELKANNLWTLYCFSVLRSFVASLLRMTHSVVVLLPAERIAPFR